MRIPPIRRGVGALTLALMAALPLASSAQSTHTLPLVLPAGGAGLEGFVRIVNRSDSSGTVRMTAIDDTGERFGPVTLSLDAGEAVHFNSRDLERGNASKGLPVGVGNGAGSWRLVLETALNITPLAYIRTADGFVTSMHDVVPMIAGRHWVVFFNPGSNRRQVSRLRLINPGTGAATVEITGRDDAGAAGGTVRLTLRAGAARTLTAHDLEAGGDGIDGRLGDGTGKWRLSVTSNVAIEVMSLLASPTGHLANLSPAPVAGDPAEPGVTFRDCPGCPEMVEVPAGSFLMGSPETARLRKPSESPVHRVTINYPFAVGVYEVTFDEWDMCVANGGCAGYRPDDEGWGRGRRPVINVHWRDAEGYVRWLSGRTGEAYRLLSESEWEYVARAGTSTLYWWGDSLGWNRANCRSCGSLWGGKRTAPVGSTGNPFGLLGHTANANPFGLYDVHGNVWEWTGDCWNPNYHGAPVDGSAWKSGNCLARTVRGSSWFNNESGSGFHVATRVGLESDSDYVTGFRVARTITP